ncbi:hypothetical protein [Aquamicrobium sp. LC103]|uniref:hypothetical protein n=1 Tax=Aquamicrobium sp. LC103 TaxID=1120658 RepID=UPI00063E89E3|nr:hypothetical protein [Aquamicrobium sp. LC103]TKT79053.1 hypothetical protein XW59_008945 [Aquamicrobium sp. LC103]
MKEGIVVFSPEEEDVYDWSGRQILPEIRRHIRAGNCVRIQVQDEANDYVEAVYVDITEVDEQDILHGIVQDIHRSEMPDGIETFRVENGETISFARRSVIEIPHDWEENENLRDLVEQALTGPARSMTGILDNSGKG